MNTNTDKSAGVNPREPKAQAATRPTAPGWWWWKPETGAEWKPLQIIRDHINGELLVGGDFADKDYQADNEPAHPWFGEWQAMAPPVSDKLPVYLNERTVRFMNALCAAADVDAAHFVEDWISDALLTQSMDEDLFLHWGPEGPGYEREPMESLRVKEAVATARAEFESEQAPAMEGSEA